MEFINLIYSKINLNKLLANADDILIEENVFKQIKEKLQLIKLCRTYKTDVKVLVQLNLFTK